MKNEDTHCGEECRGGGYGELQGPAVGGYKDAAEDELQIRYSVDTVLDPV